MKTNHLVYVNRKLYYIKFLTMQTFCAKDLEYDVASINRKSVHTSLANWKYPIKQS